MFGKRTATFSCLRRRTWLRSGNRRQPGVPGRVEVRLSNATLVDRSRMPASSDRQEAECDIVLCRLCSSSPCGMSLFQETPMLENTHRAEETNGVGPSQTDCSSPNRVESHTAFPRRRLFAGPSRSGLLCSRYEVESESEIVPHARHAIDLDSRERVLVCFYPDFRLLNRSLQFLDVLSDARHVCKPVEPDVLRLDGFPPALVFRRGNSTLQQWLLDSERYLPDRHAVLNQIFRIVQEVHSADIVVASLCPRIIEWHSEEHLWKLASLHDAACIKEGLDFSCCEAYAAPEVVRAMQDGDMANIQKPADMWSLGVITFELFFGKIPGECGKDPEARKEYIENTLLALNDDELERIALGALLQDLLCLEPNERYTVEEALRSDFFTRHVLGGLYPCRTEPRDAFLSSTALGAIMSSTVRVSVDVMRFQRNDDPELPLRQRRTKPACTIVDPDLPSASIYVIKKSETVILDISLEFSTRIDITKLMDVKITADEDQIDLRAETVQRKRNQFRSIAVLDPTHFRTRILSKRSPCFGQPKSRYVELHLDFIVVFNGGNDSFSLSKVFYVKVAGGNIMLVLSEVDNFVRNKMRATPPLMRTMVNGVMLCAQYVP